MRYDIRLQMLIVAFRTVKENGWFVLSVTVHRDYRGELLHVCLTFIESSLFLHLSFHAFIDWAQNFTFVQAPTCALIGPACLWNPPVHPESFPVKPGSLPSLFPRSGSQHFTPQLLWSSSRSLGGWQAASTLCYCYHGSSNGNICEVLHKPEISIRFTSKQV